MRWLHLRWYVWLVPVIALVAGYVTGHKPTAARNAALTVPGSSLTLEYPDSWRRTHPPATLVALGLGGSLVLAPDGQTGGGGLLVAPVAGEGAPIPKSMLAKLQGGLEGQAISLVDSPAFRYEDVSLAGSGFAATAYAIPTGAEQFTFALCFVPQADVSTRSTCEQIVESGQFSGSAASPPVELKPQAGYANELAAALAGFDRTSDRLHAAITHASTDSALAQQAGLLAGALESAESALRRLSPPAVAAHAQAELASAISAARSAYAALARAASAGDGSGFAAARAQASEAEAGIRSALQGFALVGYRIA